MFLKILKYERYLLKCFVPKNFSYFFQRSRVDIFEENSTGHFDAKIYSNISVKLAVKKYVFLILCSIFTLSFSRPKT